jgi:hypothetical protein
VSAEQQVKPPPKPGAWRRWTARVAVFLLLVGSGLVLLYLGRERWLAPLVVERAARIVREHTGLELTVDRLGGDWWNRLEIEGLSLAGTQPTTELSSLRIDRLELKIDARRLLRGDLTAITSVFADSVQAAVDLSRPLSTVPPGEPSAPAFPWPADLPLIFVGDLGLELELGDGTRGSVQGLSASNVGGQAGAGTEKFALSARHAEFASPSIGTHGAAVDLGVEYRAGLFLLDHVSFDDREVSRAARLDLRDLARGNARFGAVFDGFGGTQEFQGEVASGRLSIFVQTQTLDLAELLALLHVETSLAGRVSLGGVWEAPLDGLCHWRAHASGFADGFVFEGREVDHLEVAGSVDADVLKLREGAAWQGANTLWVEDFAVSLAALSLDELVRSLRGEARVELFLPSAVLGAAPREVLLAAGRVNHASFAVECSPFGFTVHAGGNRIRRGRLARAPRDLRLRGPGPALVPGPLGGPGGGTLLRGRGAPVRALRSRRRSRIALGQRAGQRRGPASYRPLRPRGRGPVHRGLRRGQRTHRGRGRQSEPAALATGSRRRPGAAHGPRGLRLRLGACCGNCASPRKPGPWSV